MAFKKSLSLIKILSIFKIVFRNIIKKRSEKNVFFVTLVAALSFLVLANRHIDLRGGGGGGAVGGRGACSQRLCSTRLCSTTYDHLLPHRYNRVKFKESGTTLLFILETFVCLDLITFILTYPYLL